MATFLAGSIVAQEPAADVIASWIALDAPTGHEHLAIESIQRNFSGWEKDRYGNLAKVVGNGTNRRVVACALDTYSYAVSQITEKGYLRLHRIGNGSRHPLWDQAHEGQHLRILTREGPVVGVSAITVYGAPNAGLSWSGRYSHSPAEIADLRDIAKLIDLIQAVAQAPIDN